MISINECMFYFSLKEKPTKGLNLFFKQNIVLISYRW